MPKTKAGHPVTVLTRKLAGQSRNIVGIVHSPRGDKIEQWYENGRFFLHAESELDLLEDFQTVYIEHAVIEVPHTVDLVLGDDGIYRIRGSL